MIIKPKVRGFICTTAHPQGCAYSVQQQIDYVKKQKPLSKGPTKALIIGSSTGYGLASRIVAAFGGTKASTIGVFFEKSAEDKRTATAGWYNSVAFEKAAIKEGLYAKSFNGDAFSDEMRGQVVEAVKKDLKGVDLIVYSLASPRRQHPKTAVVYKSTLKPIVGEFTSKNLDLDKNVLETITLPQATPEEVESTIAVMGGEDWEFWIDALDREKLLLPGVLTMAYSYVGPELTRPVYRNGTIGRAKDHLEATAKKLDARLKSIGGRAVVSVNKALVTQSSSAIPVIPLYFVVLNKVMKEKGVHENCIQQIWRLFSEKIYGPQGIVTDEQGLARVDDLELRADVQKAVHQVWAVLNDQNLKQYADIPGYHRDFMNLFGFEFPVNYDVDVEHDLPLPSAK